MQLPDPRQQERLLMLLELSVGSALVTVISVLALLMFWNLKI